MMLECLLDQHIVIPNKVDDSKKGEFSPRSSTSARRAQEEKRLRGEEESIPLMCHTTIQPEPPQSPLSIEPSSTPAAAAATRNPPPAHDLDQDWKHFDLPSVPRRRRLMDRKRVKSWSSEGEAYGVLRQTRYDDSYFFYHQDSNNINTDGSTAESEQDRLPLQPRRQQGHPQHFLPEDDDDDDEDDDDEEDFDFHFFTQPLVTPRHDDDDNHHNHHNDTKLTASALALRHGAALCRSQPRLALQRSGIHGLIHSNDYDDDNHSQQPTPPPIPLRSSGPPLTASALALRHGAALTRHAPSSSPYVAASTQELRQRSNHHAPPQASTSTTTTTRHNNHHNHKDKQAPVQSSAAARLTRWRKRFPCPGSSGGGLCTTFKGHKNKVVYNNPWLIPVNHPLKIAWDITTVILAIVNAYLTHCFIRERLFVARPGWIEVWYICDILLNFWTQRTTSDGTVLTTFTAVWARYLTSWFVIDVLALFPGELLYIQPVIELQKKRPFWQKLFRRTKVTLKVTTRILQSGHVPWLYKVLVKARPLRELFRLIRLLILYVPKYIMFVRNMKGVLLIRALRDWGHLRAFWKWTTYTVASSCGGPAVPEDLPPTVAGWTSEDDHIQGGGVVEEDWERLNDHDLDRYPENDDLYDDDDDYVGPF